MRVYRGPKSKEYYDATYDVVSTISSKKLQESIRDNSCIQFNVTKDGSERHSDCRVVFEDKDMIPMINGLMSRLKSQQLALLKIDEVLQDQKLNETKQLHKIRSIVKKLYIVG